MMDEDIDWTWRLGEAVISQQAEVITAVEAFRDRAYAAGNLKSDENQTVTYEEGTIEIAPVSEEIIYVPYYEPEEVVVYQPRRVYHYYPDPYPVYYYPYPVDYRFSSGYFWGVTTAFHIGWSSHYLHVYHPTYWGHPYYGYTYYGNYYRHPSINIYNTYYVNNSYRSSNYRYRDGDYWRPRSRAGSRQDEPRVRNYHYPPGGDQRRDNRRHDSSYSADNQLNNRDNGRMALNLRERSQSDRNRVAASNNVQPRVANGAANSTRTATRNSVAADSSNRNNRARAADADNRARVAPANTGTNRQRNSSETAVGGIQFRDRGNENGGQNSVNSARSSQDSRQTRVAATRRENPTNVGRQREAVAAAPRASAPAVQQRTPSARTSVPRSTTPKVSAPSRTSAPRASAPSRTSAPRASAPSRASAPKVSAPSRTSAPRVSAPSRASAPRVSAPSRTSAPRASAPSRTSAPRASAPSRASAPQRSSAGSSRSSSSSRQRNRSN